MLARAHRPLPRRSDRVEDPRFIVGGRDPCPSGAEESETEASMAVGRVMRLRSGGAVHMFAQPRLELAGDDAGIVDSGGLS